MQHPFFEEVAVSTLKYLDMLYERGDMEKSQFFKKNLPRVISMLPKVKVPVGACWELLRPGPTPLLDNLCEVQFLHLIWLRGSKLLLLPLLSITFTS